MEVIPRLSTRLFPAPTAETVPTIRRNAVIPPSFLPTCRSPFLPIPRFRDRSLRHFSRSSSRISASGWFSGFGPKKEFYPDIVKAGDPVLHEPAREVTTEEIGSEKIEKIIDSMIMAMRKAPGVGLAAPQIGVPLKIIVLEDTKEYIGYASKREIEAQDRRPFNLLVILNPVFERKGNKTALFFEGCLRLVPFALPLDVYRTTGINRVIEETKSMIDKFFICECVSSSSMNPNYEATQPTVDGMSSKADVAAARRPNVQEFNVDGYRGMVERHLEVEVTGLDRAGNPIKVVAKGWQARILQHECDHLDGTVYVDKMLPRTFRSVENLGLPLPAGCPKLGNR